MNRNISSIAHEIASAYLAALGEDYRYQRFTQRRNSLIAEGESVGIRIDVAGGYIRIRGLAVTLEVDLQCGGLRRADLSMLSPAEAAPIFKALKSYAHGWRALAVALPGASGKIGIIHNGKLVSAAA